MEYEELKALSGITTDSVEQLAESAQDWKKFNFKEVVKQMGGKYISTDKSDGSIMFSWKNGMYILADNGGEANIFKLEEKPAVDFSIAYSGNNFPTGQIKSKTFGYRLKQALEGKKIDYEKDVDDNTTRSMPSKK